MANNTYTRYEARTGRVIDVVEIPESAYDRYATLLHDGTVDGSTHYFVAGVPIERPAQTTAVDVEEIDVTAQEFATLTNLPSDCSITIIGPEFHDVVTVTDGSLEFSAVFPGDYAISVEAFPYLPWTTTIHAVQGQPAA